MAIIGNISTINVNGNELTIKDAALTEIVNEIIDAIGANNTNIAERINDLHNRSFDNTIKISSQNESEIASIQDGLYKIQYVTVTGEGDNATETLNNSAILIQDGTNQYLYKDGQLSSRTKDNNTWGSWITFEGGVTSVNGQTGAVTVKENVQADWNATTGDAVILNKPNLSTYENKVTSVNGQTGAVNINVGVTSFNGATGAITYTAPVTSVNGMTGAVTISHPVTSTKQSKINYITGSPGPNGTAFGVSTSQYIHFDTGDFNVNINSSNGHLYFNTNEVALKNDIKVSSVNGMTGAVVLNIPVTSVNGQTGAVTITETQLSKGTATGTGNAVTDINVSNHQITLVKGATYATQEDINESISNLVNSAPTTLDTLNELATALGNDPNFATTVATQIGEKYTKPSTGIPASDLAAGVIPDVPVQSVNGQTGAVTVNVGVTSFNGSTGAVTYTAPVTSVNGQTGEVNLSIPSKTSDLTNDSKFIQDKGGNDLNFSTSVIDGAFSNEDIVLTCNNHNAAVNVNPGGINIISNWAGSSSGVNNNGTGNVNINTSQGKAYYNNKEIATVDQIVAPPVTSVNGQTGAVTLTIPAAVTESTVAGWGFTKNTGTLTTETQLSKGTATGTGNAVTDINVSNHQITLVKGATYATQEDINESISSLVNSAPTTLDTLNELATALGNDPNFATTVATQIGEKYTKPSTGIPASDLAAGVIPAVPVQSVNGQTGAVTVKANVQSDWNATTGDAVILNKPTIPTVNDSTVTLTMNGNTVGTFTLNKSGNTTIDLGTVLTSHQSIKTVNNESLLGTGNVNISGLPTVTSADNGKVLMVVNGAWQLVSPVSLYSGSSAPSNSQGNNGDIYVQS